MTLINQQNIHEGHGAPSGLDSMRVNSGPVTDTPVSCLIDWEQHREKSAFLGHPTVSSLSEVRPNHGVNVGRTLTLDCLCL